MVRFISIPHSQTRWHHLDLKCMCLPHTNRLFSLLRHPFKSQPIALSSKVKCNLQVTNIQWWKKYFPHSSKMWFYDALAQETSVSIFGFKGSDVHFVPRKLLWKEICFNKIALRFEVNWLEPDCVDNHGPSPICLVQWE